MVDVLMRLLKVCFVLILFLFFKVLTGFINTAKATKQNTERTRYSSWFLFTESGYIQNLFCFQILKSHFFYNVYVCSMHNQLIILLIKSATSVCMCCEGMYSKIVQFIYNLKTKAGEDCVEIACFHNHTAWNMIFDFSEAITDTHVSFFIHVLM